MIDTGEDGRAHLTDEPQFAGRSGLRIRGQSSQGWPKKQYAFETWAEGNSDTSTIAAQYAADLAVELLGMPEESDWIIQGPYSDKTLMRNFLSYTWSNDIGQYAPRTRFVEVFVNTGGGKLNYNSDYVGSYVFMEKIKQDPNRVDVEPISPDDNQGMEVTGGYIWKKDKSGAGDQPWTTSRGQQLRHVEPKARDITPQQQAYLKNYINEFESVLYGPNFQDPAGGYAKYIDVDSWIDHFIIVELSKNIDGFRLSTYYHKDRGGKIAMGPVWDYNLSLGNADYLGGWQPSGWYFDGLGDTEYPYWRRLFQDPNFQQRLVDRWGELRQNELSTEKLLTDVDAAAATLSESQARNFQKWRIQGVELWPNWYVGQTWQDEVGWMRQWLQERVAWIDSQFVTAVQFSQDGGVVEPGFKLTLSEPPGTVYYTLDGTDPRLPGGGVAPSAQIYSTGGTLELPLVDRGSTWKYLDNGSNQGTAWRAADFNDNSWDSGPAELGYGDGDEATVVGYGSSSSNKHVTTYFRHSFDVADTSDVAGVMLRLIRDDGAVVYLNGEEIARSQMPGGTIAYDTFASATAGGNQERVYYQFNLEDLSLLVPGENVLAVEVHQANRTSSDISFDLELLATIEETGTEGRAIPIDANTRVIVRTRDGAEWSAPAVGTFVLEALAPLVIGEINYHPHDPTDAELAVDPSLAADDFEFIELKNIGQQTLSLVGVEFVDGITFDFTSSDVRQLAAGQHVVIARNRSAFEIRYAAAVPLAGEYDALLSNGGEQVTLNDGAGRTLFDVVYNDAGGWPGRADGKGATLVWIGPGGDPNGGDPNDNDNWRSSVRYGGTPGADPEPKIGVVVNEVLTHTDLPAVDTIELYNATDDAVDLGGWYLSDSWGWEPNELNGNYKKFRIPDGTVIPSGGYRVFDETDFNPNPLDPALSDFALSGAHGDDVWLMKADAEGSLTHFVDHVEFGAARRGESFGRWSNGQGGMVPMVAPTLDPQQGANSGPRVGPVIVSEVHYNTGGPDDANEPEFVEIYNPTAATIDLTGWRIRRGVDFDFTAGTQLAAGAVLVVLPFDPTDQANDARWADFCDRYGLDAGQTAAFVGGYSGILDNGGDTVQLQRPDEPPLDEPQFIPRLLEDEVAYDDLAPWPLTADGGGHSLHRAAADAWGHDAGSWTAAAPTPGVVDFSQSATVVGRYVFYNNSAFDLSGDDVAVAPDKTALLPGHKATFANYTSYSRGINGVMLDVAGLVGTPTVADFQFRVGNNDDTDGWAAAASPQQISVREGAGIGGSDRVAIIWPDHAVQNQWLQVTVLATPVTALQENDVFYFGNAVGESGNSTAEATVTSIDEILTRSNPQVFDPAAIDDAYDFDRDRLVGATDQIIARHHLAVFDALQLIAPPPLDLNAAEPAEVAAAPVFEAEANETAFEPGEDFEPSLTELVRLLEHERTVTQQRSSGEDRALAEMVDALLAAYWRWT